MKKFSHSRHSATPPLSCEQSPHGPEINGQKSTYYKLAFDVKFTNNIHSFRYILYNILFIFTKTITIMQITLNCNHFEKRMNLLSPILFTLKNFILSRAKKLTTYLPLKLLNLGWFCGSPCKYTEKMIKMHYNPCSFGFLVSKRCFL